MKDQRQIRAVVFDIGGVLIEWDPRYLYRKLFDDKAEMERFLSQVCTPEWHAEHDRGVPFKSSCAALAQRYPQHREAIMAWGRRSEEMETGEIAGSVEVLAGLRQAGIPCYALTNMEQETYPRRLERYPFMSWFDGIVVSYQEGVIKPEPEIFRRLLSRFDLRAERTVLIDDRPANLDAAAALGMPGVQFTSPQQLRACLRALGLPLSAGR